MMKKFFLTVFVITVLAALPSYAALTGQLGVLNVTANGGINPATGKAWKVGDKYRLIFITSQSTDAVSADIATYNAFVQDVANAAGLGSVNWYVVASTRTVNARDNTGTNPNVNGTGEAIFLMDGKFAIAKNYADLWNGIKLVVTGGSLDPAYGIYLDENRNEFFPSPDRIFTGSWPNGTAVLDQGDKPLGETPVQTGQNYRAEAKGFSSYYWMREWKEDNTQLRPVYAISEPLTVQEIYPSVDPGHNWITWSGQPVILDPNVVNNDTQVPVRPLIIVWSANPAEGVSITEDGTAPDDTTTPQAVVTVIKSPETANPSVVRLMLSVTLDGVVTINDIVTIDVYDNSCKAAEAVGGTVTFDPADFNKDCIIDINDLSIMAEAWLENY